MDKSIAQILEERLDREDDPSLQRIKVEYGALRTVLVMAARGVHKQIPPARVIEFSIDYLNNMITASKDLRRQLKRIKLND